MSLGKYVIAAVGLVLVFLIGKCLRRRAKRRRLRTAPFPAQWEQIVQKNVPLYNRLPESMRDQLGGLVNVFLAEKDFEGCAGLEMNDEIRVTIAAQACMLLLNRKTAQFRKLRTILVYPHTYAARTSSSDGNITIEGRSVRLGESWQNGPVVLAWDSVTGGTSNIADARNVVLHEEYRSRYIAWARVLGAEYESLQRRKKTRRRSIMNKYGATNPAEFFAVATETFFEKAKQMKKRHPELYDELREYYKLDPIEWV